MIRAIKYLAIVLVLLGAIAAGVMALVPADSFRQPIETAVRSATHRDFTIAGPMRFVFSPTLAIEVRDISLGGDGPKAMLTARRAVLDVDLLPLLSGEVKVTRLMLEGAEITLSRDAAGTGNWELRNGDVMKMAEPGPADVLADLGFGDITLRDSRVAYQAPGGTTYAVQVADMRVRWPRDAETMTLTGALAVAGETLDLEALIESPRQALSSGRAPMRVSFTSPLASGTFDGDADLAALRLEGGLTLSTSSARRLAGVFGIVVPGDRGMGRLSIAAAASVKPGEAVLHDAKFSLDAMAGSGDLTLSVMDGRPSISGALAVDMFDSYAYVAPQEPDDADDDAEGWGVAAIDLSGLSAFDAKLGLRVRRGVFAGLRYENAQTDLTVAHGRARLEIANANLYGGTARGRFEAGVAAGRPELALALTLSGMDGQSFLNDAAELTSVTGRADLTLELASTGVTRRERMRTLGGTARLQLTGGSLDGIDLEAMARSGASIAPDEDAATNFSSLAADIRLDQGVATIAQLVVATPGLTLNGGGTADMAERKLSLSFAPANASGSGFSASGDWAAPVYAAAAPPAPE